MMNKTEFQDMFRNDLRGNKNRWLYLRYPVNNNTVELAIYNNWAKIFIINGGNNINMPLRLTQKELIQIVSDRIYG